MEKKRKKKFKLMDAVLGTVCLTLVCESVMPTAAIGSQQYFWWIFLLICFCLPYGMITAELGTTYPSEGGMYDWVKRAFGPKWAGRVAWNYWINFPLWIASLAVAVTNIFAGMFNIDLPIWALLIMQLGYVWLVTFLSTKRIGESKAIVNLGTILKVIILLTIGLVGIYAFIKTGKSANPISSAKDIFPSLNLADLSFVSIILFNFMGFEVVGTWVDDMDEPKKQIPKALIIGGLLMALFYILPATGFNIAIPADADWIGADGAEIMVDVLKTLFTNVGFASSLISTLVIILGFMLIYTFIANIASWSFGVNEVAKYAAEDGSLPKMFAPVNKEGVPYQAAIINGVVASIIVILGLVAGEISEGFSAGFGLFFCLSWITLLVGYIPMFLAFLKLRKIDAKKERPYKVPGGNFMIKVAAIVPFVILIAGVVFTIFGDFTNEYILDNIPLIIGVIISFAIEEILIARIAPSAGKSLFCLLGAITFAIIACLVAQYRIIWICIAASFAIVAAFSYIYHGDAIDKEKSKKSKK